MTFEIAQFDLFGARIVEPSVDTGLHVRPAASPAAGVYMRQCQDCEHYHAGADGQVAFTCNPFGTIVEPECLQKWQLLRMTELTQKVDRMVEAYEATVAIYKRMQPLQEKMLRQMEREMEEQEDAEAWKYSAEDDDEDDEDKLM